MIHRTDHDVTNWIGTVLPDTTVVLGPPGSVADGNGVCLYLMELAPSPPLRGTDRPPLQVELRYLVTTWAETPDDAHRVLGELLFAALERPDLDVELRPLPGETWTAFGIAPVPSFILRIPLRRERPLTPAPRVRTPMRLDAATLGSLTGIVLLPDGTPLPGARVELAELDLNTRTNGNGRFHFPSVPDGYEGSPLRVTAKGRTVSTKPPTSDAMGRTVVVRFDPSDPSEQSADPGEE